MTRDSAIQHWYYLPTLMVRNRFASITLFVTVILLLSLTLRGQTKAPLTLDQVRSLIGIGAPDATIAHEIESRGVAFQASVSLLNELEREHAGRLRVLAGSQGTDNEIGGGHREFNGPDRFSRPSFVIMSKQADDRMQLYLTTTDSQIVKPQGGVNYLASPPTSVNALEAVAEVIGMSVAGTKSRH